MSFTVGPKKKPARLLASNTFESRLMLVTFRPPLTPKLIPAFAVFAVKSIARAIAADVKIFFIPVFVLVNIQFAFA